MAALGRVVGTMAMGISAAALLFVSAGLLTDRWRVMPVLSGSMEPAIPAGAIAVTTPADAAAVREGDVIVFHAPTPDAPVVMHRVVEVVERGGRPLVRTRGDANTAPDPWLARIEDDRVWTVRRVIPTIGHAVLLAHHPALRLTALSVAAAVLAGAGLVRIWRPRTSALGQPRAT